MSWSQSTITSVNPPVYSRGQVHISWTSSSPYGTWFQVYVNQRLSYCGIKPWCTVSSPSSRARIDIGTIGPGEQQTNFLSSLPSSPQTKANLVWTGGTFQSSDIVGFYVYGSTANGPINYSTPLATIPVKSGPNNLTGWNMGGWNSGGWNQVGGSYYWTSQSLSSGVWSFEIVPYDVAGNKGAGVIANTTVVGPPPPPGYSNASRLSYTFANSKITLSWIAA